MSLVTLFPPFSSTPVTTAANGRPYTADPGQGIVVPDFDAAVLTANGWTFRPSGPTVRMTPNRPGPIIVNDRLYTGVVDTALVVPRCDAVLLEANGWSEVLDDAAVADPNALGTGI